MKQMTALFLLSLVISAFAWDDISTSLIASEGLTTAWPGGCAGVAADRLTGPYAVAAQGLFFPLHGRADPTRCRRSCRFSP